MEAHLAARGERRRVAVVWGADESTRHAVETAVSKGFAEAVFLGPEGPAGEHMRSIPASDPDDAARKAVAMVRSGEADIIMKGLLNTDNLLRAVLSKTDGILRPGRVLTHVTVAEIPAYPKLLSFSDAAVIPVPTLEQRRAQVSELIETVRSLGVAEPRVALIHCSEKTDLRHFPVTGDYEMLRADAASGAWGPCIVDGPMDVKTACDCEAMLKKGLSSPIAGEADALLMPDIESGNVFYKTIHLFGSALTAGLLRGAEVPVVLPSRGDDPESKFYSLCLAAL